jgi:hypothetical protein
MLRRLGRPKRPSCYLCIQDEIYDRRARHPPADVRVGICREPYALAVCHAHLTQLEHALPTGGVWVVERLAGADGVVSRQVGEAE